MPIPEESKPAVDEQIIQVDETKIVKGKVTLMKGEKWWLKSTPTILARITQALRYFCVAIIGSVSATDLFTGRQAKLINFGLSIFIYFLGAVDVMVGVEPAEREKALKIMILAWSLMVLNELITHI